ncbi:hypothetical protein BD311DRAFT_748449 [Dichomitus squalens]|uniref:Uncharacterized protein n=1 Tax=Dichomitus squalens TaxID=114155 RepID=A0A4Q9MZW0_9APHY|nr:hypothetical protein BD311DRAFT_748449 [Dichomitus squalens]
MGRASFSAPWARSDLSVWIAHICCTPRTHSTRGHWRAAAPHCCSIAHTYPTPPHVFIFIGTPARGLHMAGAA